MKFRKDINGLRAVAVLAVMLYHFGLPGFTGGFAGVDIFFVISGFLMTGIILGGMQRGDFGFGHFYISRCKRIWPALAALCLALLCFGWFWLATFDYKMLGRHAASALGFVSNFILKNESGYFDTFSKDKFLLHTWSLSVEWQFYLIYPLLLAVLTGWFWRKKNATATADMTPRIRRWLIMLAIASFALCVWMTPTHSAFSFYLLPTRLWELLAGGVIYLIAIERPAGNRNGLAAFALGFIFILASIVAFDSNTLWPGYYAALPVCGTMLVIWAARQDMFVLNHPVMQKIGIWSYSIYLWHWPVMVVLRHKGYEQLLYADLVGMVLSVGLGAASYYLIETPFRKGTVLRLKPRLSAQLGIAALLAILLAGFAVDKAKGFPARVPENVRKIEQEVAESEKLRPRLCNKKDRFSFYAYNCDKQKPDFIVLGDSHGMTSFKGIENAAGDQKAGRLYQMTCPPFRSAYLSGRDHSRICDAFYEYAFQDINALPSDIPLFFIFRHAMYLHGPNEHPKKDLGLTFTDTPTREHGVGSLVKNYQRKLTETVCLLSRNGRPVYIVSPVPEVGIDVPNTMIRRIIFDDTIPEISLPLDAYRERQKTVLGILGQTNEVCSNTEILDPVPYLCPDGTCRTIENGLPVYTDDNHLARIGNQKLAEMYAGVLKKHQQ